MSYANSYSRVSKTTKAGASHQRARLARMISAGLYQVEPMEPRTLLNGVLFAPPLEASCNFPYASATGDFNHDGQLDLAVSRSDNKIGILFGKGNNTFALPVLYPGHWIFPGTIKVVDLNNDSNLDLVVHSFGQNNEGIFDVLLGKADGTFSPVVGYSTRSRSERIAVLDLNGDNLSDLLGITANYYDSDGHLHDNFTITVLLNQGGGVFGSPAEYPIPLYQREMCVGDFNGDSRPDIITSGGTYSQFTLLFNNGSGGFPTQQFVSTQRTSISGLIAADINGDHKLDIVATQGTGNGTNNILIYRGDGAGGFTLNQEFSAGANLLFTNPAGVPSADDLDGDNDIDLIFMEAYSDRVIVFQNNADGQFDRQVITLFDHGSALGYWINSISLSDINKDGKTDLLASYYDHNVIELFLQIAPPPTNPGTIVVNSISDSPVAGYTTLREAIALANAATAPTTITFDPRVFSVKRTITLSNGQLSLSNNAFATTIIGPSAGLKIDGGGATRVFGISGNAVIKNLSIVNGYVAGGSMGGAGILNTGTLSLQGVTLSGNRAYGGGITRDAAYSQGGAIYNEGSISMLSVTIANNYAEQGGAIFNYANVKMINSTLSANSAKWGAGVFDYGSGPTPSGLTDFKMGNSLVAGNINANDASMIDDFSGGYVSLGNNLVGITNANVGPLIDNGGPTPTMMLLPGSPALDAGSNALLPAGVTSDQRGFWRFINGKTDIGAVERQAVVSNITSISGTLFDDKDANGVRDTGEAVLVKSLVYIDANNNGIFDNGEKATLTDSAGKYTFAVAPGTYRIRKYLRPGFVVTTPGIGYWDVTVAAGQIVTGKDFGHAFAVASVIRGLD